MILKKHFGSIVVFALIVSLIGLFVFLGYKLSYKKDIEKIDIPISK